MKFKHQRQHTRKADQEARTLRRQIKSLRHQLHGLKPNNPLFGQVQKDLNQALYQMGEA